MKGGLSKNVISEEGEFSMGHVTFVPSNAGLTNLKRWSFHEGGLSK